MLAGVDVKGHTCRKQGCQLATLLATQRGHATCKRAAVSQPFKLNIVRTVAVQVELEWRAVWGWQLMVL